MVSIEVFLNNRELDMLRTFRDCEKRGKPFGYEERWEDEVKSVLSSLACRAEIETRTFCDLDDVWVVDRERDDIPMTKNEGFKIKETYRDVAIEVYFSCQCYAIEPEHAVCGDKFYVTYEGVTYTDSYVYSGESGAIDAAKKLIDLYLSGETDEKGGE